MLLDLRVVLLKIVELELRLMHLHRRLIQVKQLRQHWYFLDGFKLLLIEAVSQFHLHRL